MWSALWKLLTFVLHLASKKKFIKFLIYISIVISHLCLYQRLKDFNKPEPCVALIELEIGEISEQTDELFSVSHVEMELEVLYF